ncbi:MAG: DnaJ domain-containing protein [Clostridiales bacterium]|nr:DnaJ domain-containing protein [Clostridiales bacterium]
MKNYYQILNVQPSATEADIKRSYRVLAKRYHPDVNPGDTAAADKFADINEANAVLSDPKARAEYDVKLKEAASARLNPEDVIARQRAQAQAAARQAARQAAYRNGAMNNMSASARRDATIARARQAAQAQAQAQAQYQNAQVQAQVQALRNQAFQSGREQGAAEAKAAAEAEIARLNASIRSLLAENKKLKKNLDDETADLKRQLNEAEQDRRELEVELFNRDRELSQEQIRAKEIEEQLIALREEDGLNNEAVRKAEAESAELRAKLEKALLCIKKLEQDKGQAELTNQAQIQLQQDKRRQMQEEIEELNRQVDALTSEIDVLRAENDQWQQYAQSEEFISDTERRMGDWAKKTQADRRKAKPTLYGVLGVLIWATDEEINDAYAKLVKRYVGKTDETIVAKLAKVKEAYAVLSDAEKRAEYNKSINVTDEMIAEERRLIAENESIMEEYRNRLAGKEFWAHFDELTANALEGDASAQNSLGEMYYYGDEIERDYEQAVFWFKEAAKQKHPDGMYNLGVCFVNGEGIERNEATGQSFIRQAAKLGSKAALAAGGEKPTKSEKSSGGSKPKQTKTVAAK